jgi:hypothetical protein
MSAGRSIALMQVMATSDLSNSSPTKLFDCSVSFFICVAGLP